METARKKKSLNYDDIEPIVEYLVRTKSRSYMFDTYSKDDIAQEIRIICLNALPKVDLERVKEGKLQNFFGRCVDNGLKNLKRDNYVRVSSPYKKRFELLEDSDESVEAEEIRAKWARHQKNIKTKLSIRHACPIDGMSEILNNERFQLEMEYKDLERFLFEKATDDVIIPLKLILSGRAKEITRNEKKRVQKFVKKVLEGQ